MQELVGIARSQESLAQALEEIQNLCEKAENVHAIGNREYNAGWHTALDLDCLLTISEAIALAALERKASIGAHSRDDYPEKEEPGTEKYNTIIQKTDDGSMAIRREPVPELPDELQQIIEEMG
jgi:succinate dehydrogenase / fumarate reductase flavoprotein subunit